VNASQQIAWLVCLAVALFASVLALRNGYRTAVLEKRFAAVSQAATTQAELLEDIHQVLQQIEQHLSRQSTDPAPAEASTQATPMP